MQPTLAASAAWTLPHKILFRFITCFIILWIFPIHFVDTIVSSLPEKRPAIVDDANNLIGETTNDLATSSFNALLNLIPGIKNLFPSGITSYDEWASFAFLFIVILFSIGGCLFWSLLD